MQSLFIILYSNLVGVNLLSSLRAPAFIWVTPNLLSGYPNRQNPYIANIQLQQVPQLRLPRLKDFQNDLFDLILSFYKQFDFNFNFFLHLLRIDRIF